MEGMRRGALCAGIGALVGMAAAGALWGPVFLGRAPAGEALADALGQEGATAVLFVLFARLGGTVGAAALPFADDGPTLMVCSVLHFGATALEVLLILRLCFQVREPGYLLGWLGILALLYLLIWLGRYVGWCLEVAAIRERLGLPRGPSPLKWRETLPYLPLALLLCLIVPFVLRLCDATDVPVLSGLLYPYLLLPAGGIFSGLSLGRRRGICPLYPVLCGLCTLGFIPLARLVSNMDDWPLLPIAVGSTLIGNCLGAAWRKASGLWVKKSRP